MMNVHFPTRALLERFVHFVADRFGHDLCDAADASMVHEEFGYNPQRASRRASRRREPSIAWWKRMAWERGLINDAATARHVGQHNKSEIGGYGYRLRDT